MWKQNEDSGNEDLGLCPGLPPASYNLPEVTPHSCSSGYSHPTWNKRAMEELELFLKVLFCRLKKLWQHKATTLFLSQDKLESATAFETSVVLAKIDFPTRFDVHWRSCENIPK